MFEIRDGLPPPPSLRKGYKWPFAKMAINQHIVIEDTKAWPYACHAAHGVASRKNWKFSCQWDKNFIEKLSGPDDKSREEKRRSPRGIIWRTA